MHKVGKITTIVQDHVQGLAIGKDNGLLNTPNIFVISLALPGIDWDTTSSNSSSSMVLLTRKIRMVMMMMMILLPVLRRCCKRTR